MRQDLYIKCDGGEASISVGCIVGDGILWAEGSYTLRSSIVPARYPFSSSVIYVRDVYSSK
jgi:hypothetical protein